MEKLVISIISTNQGKLLDNLLNDLKNNKIKCKIIVTLNSQNENIEGLSKFSNYLNLRFIKNKKTLGFAKNHNNAFKLFKSKYFLILNPDLRFKHINLNSLTRLLDRQINLGVVTHSIKDISLMSYDNFRKFPNFFTPLSRKILKRGYKDYSLSKICTNVDWISGMFMIFNSKIFEKIGMFDEGYQLYYEDVDICRRLKFDKKKVAVYKEYASEILHNPRRDSHRKIKYLIFHINSHLRYFFNK